ncbi:histidine kinase [Nocardia sp. NPDC051030]|uniref:sensor histidine kinase n=1 Tax=Nocardia sp. NPDC051030 TaxID=3155162 RepID=UPI00342978C6
MSIRDDAVVPWSGEGVVAAWVRGLPGWVADVVVTVLVTVATVGPQVAERRGWWVIGLGVLGSVPLLWRRREPLVAGGVVGAGVIGLACAHALPVLPYGTVVCSYTIAAYSGAIVRRISVVAGGLGILVSLILPGEPVESYGYAALSFLTAWTLGTGVRARHAQIELLRERALRVDEERVAAVARERVSIARDVHDIVTHAVGLMIVQAETGPLFTHTDPDRADATFAGIADTGRSAVHELRLSLASLRDGQDKARHQPGLATIPDLVDMCRRGGVAATFIEKGDSRPVSGEVGVAAYRVVQQALTNTLEHARAEHVEVVLDWSTTQLTVRVADDGAARPGTSRTGTSTDRIGIEPTGPRLEPTGTGLIGMRERVEACGGVLRTNGSGAGFTVVAELPIAREV